MLATPEDVAARLPPDVWPEPPAATVEAALTDASALALRVVGDGPDGQPRWTDDVPPADVVAIVAKAAVRAIDSPRGTGQLTQGSRTEAFGARQVGGPEMGTWVFLTSQERADLRVAAGRQGWTSVSPPHEYGFAVDPRTVREGYR